MYDTIIIGAGIAGLTAAIYASRKRMQFEIISADFGGQFLLSGEVLNYPGIIETTGAGFAKIMDEQMKFNNVKVKLEKVSRVEKEGDDFKVITDKQEYLSRSIIITTGARARKLGVPGEEKFANKGVAYCSICDGPLFQDQEVAIIGGGDAAMEGADFMLNIAKKISIIDFEPSFRAQAYLKEKIEDNPKVESYHKTKIIEIIGDRFVTGIKIEQDRKVKELPVKGIIIEAGRMPNTEFVKDLLKIDEHGHIIIDCTGHTSVPGIFAAGDCASGHEYQYVIAAGQGCMALIKAARYLAGKKQ